MILHQLDNHPEVVCIVLDRDHLFFLFSAILLMWSDEVGRVRFLRMKMKRPAWCWQRLLHLGPGSICWPEVDTRRPLSAEMERCHDCWWSIVAIFNGAASQLPLLKIIRWQGQGRGIAYILVCRFCLDNAICKVFSSFTRNEKWNETCRTEVG